MPKVSIIIPTYNAENFLERTVESVLSQTYKDFEIILIDDFSNDNTPQIIRHYQNNHSNIKGIFLDQNHGSPAYPDNVAFKQVSGEYVAYLGHDDEWLPTKLEKQIKLFEDKENPADFVGCHAIVVKKGIEVVKKIQENNLLERLSQVNVIPHPSVIIARKEVYEKVGPFDERLILSHDWDILLRIAKMGYNFKLVDEPLVKYHIHNQNLSKLVNYDQQKKEYEIFFGKHKALLSSDRKTHSLHLRKLASLHALTGEITEARKLYIKALSKNIYDLKTYFYLILTFLGKKIFQNLYGLRRNLN